MDPDFTVHYDAEDRMANEGFAPQAMVRLLEAVVDQQHHDARRQRWTLVLVALSVLIAVASLVVAVVK